MSKIYLFGSTGFIGNAVLSYLKEKDLNVVAINRDDYYKILKSPLRFRNRISEDDIIVLCAAKVPAKNSADVVENMRLIQEYCFLFKDLKFSYLLNLSSDAVYSDFSRPINENDCLEPKSVHGCMHMIREYLLKDKFESRMGNLRPTLVYGPKDSHNGYGPNRFIRQALNKREIEVIGDGEERRDHIYIKDLTEIIFKMISTKFIGNLNAVSGKVIDFKSIAFLVRDLVPGTRIRYLQRSNTVLPHNGYREFDVSKLFNVFPKLKLTEIESGLKETIKEGN